MNKTAIAIATAASLTFFAGPLAAEATGTGAASTDSAAELTQGQPHGEGMGQANMDADQIMEQYDTNDDGELNEDELSVSGATAAGQTGQEQEHGEKMMQRLDEDDDGAVTKEELNNSDMVKGEEQSMD